MTTAPGTCSTALKTYLAVLYLLALAMALAAQPAWAAADTDGKSDGKSSLEFSNWQGPALAVFVSEPETLRADTPVVIVMHGVGRNAEEYRDQWHELARKHEFLLAVPHFSQADFPGAAGYNLGNTFAADGSKNPTDLWSFTAIEPLFDHLRQRFSLQTNSYALYGHSAGGQFVHRYLMHLPGSRVSSYVPANSGWYTLPDFDQAFPYGLENSLVSREMLAAALQSPVTILLGDRDIDVSDRNLRHTAKADAQGLTRLARGFSFFEAARKAALELGVPFNWHIATVRGVAHDNALMAPAAIPYLLP